MFIFLEMCVTYITYIFYLSNIIDLISFAKLAICFFPQLVCTAVSKLLGLYWPDSPHQLVCCNVGNHLSQNQKEFLHGKLEAQFQLSEVYFFLLRIIG